MKTAPYATRWGMTEGEDPMELELLWQMPDCNGGDCPAIYRTKDGDYVVQGWEIDDETRGNLHNLGVDESAVRVPAAVIDMIRSGRTF